MEIGGGSRQPARAGSGEMEAAKRRKLTPQQQMIGAVRQPASSGSDAGSSSDDDDDRRDSAKEAAFWRGAVATVGRSGGGGGGEQLCGGGESWGEGQWLFGCGGGATAGQLSHALPGRGLDSADFVELHASSWTSVSLALIALSRAPSREALFPVATLEEVVGAPSHAGSSHATVPNMPPQWFDGAVEALRSSLRTWGVPWAQEAATGLGSSSDDEGDEGGGMWGEERLVLLVRGDSRRQRCALAVHALLQCLEAALVGAKPGSVLVVLVGFLEEIHPSSISGAAAGAGGERQPSSGCCVQWEDGGGWGEFVGPSLRSTEEAFASLLKSSASTGAGARPSDGAGAGPGAGADGGGGGSGGGEEQRQKSFRVAAIHGGGGRQRAAEGARAGGGSDDSDASVD